jgi:hypothetical protein
MGQIDNGQLCPRLLALAALIGGALALRAASGRQLGARAVDGALAAGLRLLGAKDGFIPII